MKGLHCGYGGYLDDVNLKEKLDNWELTHWMSRQLFYNLEVKRGAIAQISEFLEDLTTNISWNF